MEWQIHYQLFKVTLNEWTHIALVRDNGSKDIKIYVNGKLETINSYTIEPSTSNSEKLHYRLR